MTLPLLALCWATDGNAKNTQSSNAQGNSAQASAAAAPAAAATTPSSASPESQILALNGAAQIAKSVAKSVCTALQKKGFTTANPATVVIYDQATFANMLTFQAFNQNAKLVANAYRTLFPAAAGPDHASSGDSLSTSYSISPIGDVTGFISMLAQGSNTESYGTITIPDSVLALQLSHFFISAPCAVVKTVAYPPLFGRGAAGNQANADLQAILGVVNTARSKAHSYAYTTGGVSGSGAATNTFPAAGLSDIDVMYDNLMNSLINPNASTNLPGSQAVLQGMAIASLLNDTNTYVLLSTVLAAGGTARDHKTFWTDIWAGDVITYSGAVMVGTALWNAADDNGPLMADILRVDTGLVDEPVTNGAVDSDTP